MRGGLSDSCLPRVLFLSAITVRAHAGLSVRPHPAQGLARGPAHQFSSREPSSRPSAQSLGRPDRHGAVERGSRIPRGACERCLKSQPHAGPPSVIVFHSYAFGKFRSDSHSPTKFPPPFPSEFHERPSNGTAERGQGERVMNPIDRAILEFWGLSQNEGHRGRLG